MVNLKLYMPNLYKTFFVFFCTLCFFTEADAQSTEVSGGVSYASFLGGEREFWQPRLGYQFAIQLLDELPYSMDAHSYGVMIGFFPFHGHPDFQNNQIDSGEYRSLWVETAFTYRYDRYFLDFVGTYVGTDVGFQFVNHRNQQGLLMTSIQSRLMLAPKIGLNVDFNEYFALYLEGRYNLSLGFGSPEMEIPYSNWQHLWNLSTGLRFRF
jgi:hypothetical protein